MKKLYTIVAAILLTSSIFAQAPEKMSYQVVIRDGSDALLVGKTVGMQISIVQGSALGTAVYIETHTPTTNANGLVSIAIGMGTPVSGTFTGIDWSAGPNFIKTETDPLGGTNYTISGTSQLLSVPYALYAKTAEKLVDTGYSTNAAFGSYALYSNTDGGNNTAIGSESLIQNTSGNGNTSIGAGSGYDNETGTNNTLVGYNTGVQVDGLNNATAIGANTYAGSSNSLILGNNANVGIGTISPTAKLEVIGNIKITDGTEGVGKVLMSDAQGASSWAGFNFYYADRDLDGFGDPWSTVYAPVLPPGYILNNTDCDDTDGNLSTQQLYYQDLDGDGFGNPNNSTFFCVGLPQVGWVLDNTDCADNNADLKLFIDTIKTSSLSIGVIAGVGGDIFGSITTLMVYTAFQEQYGIEVDRKFINIPDIKFLGVFQGSVTIPNCGNIPFTFEVISL